MKKIYYTILIVVATTIVAIGQRSLSYLPDDITGDSQTISPTNSENYVLTYNYLVESTSTSPENLLTGQVSPEIQYFDGLGRHVQTILVKHAVSGRSMISLKSYDNYGRLKREFLPYGYTYNTGGFVDSTTFIGQQRNFFISYGNEKYYAFSETDYEASPLNRVLKQGAPGEDWQINSHPIEFAYKTNTGQIGSFIYTGSSFSTLNYAAGTLFVNETTDEDGNIVAEYLDKEGKVIQKKIGNDSTLYCYDEFSLLRCVIQPSGTAYSPDSVNHCFLYNYDSRKRLIEKSIPGKGTEYFIYDSRDRLVLIQDANQRDSSKWSYTIYDNLNRPVELGTWETATTKSTLISSIGANLNYMSGQGGRVVLKEIQYDNYAGIGTDYKLNSDSVLLGAGFDQATNNIGRITCEITRLLNDPDSALMTVYRYDKYGRIVQTIADSHLGGIDYITTCYNFSGQDTLTRYRHRDSIYYDMKTKRDHRGRPIKVIMQISGGTETIVAGYDYKDDGNVLHKFLHSQNGNDFMQKCTHSYNIRGWLKSVDSPSYFNDNDKFGYELYYNDPPSGYDSCNYNGNISYMKWGIDVNPNKLYEYSYDNHNRLASANFIKSGYNANAYDVNYTYDANGNLSTLERYGISGTTIDDLEYTYNSGNRLSYVNDVASTAYVTNYPGDNNSNYFGYDSNGNMNNEPNKEMSINYNLLNLPEEISAGQNKQIDYFYTFDGVKLRKTVEDNGTITKVDYCGPFEYQTVSGTRSLKRIHTPEGVALYEGGNWIYDYYLKDHLGNTRIIVRTYNGGQTSTVSQFTDYFPFGMEMTELSVNFDDENYRYLYNGKEHQNGFDLDWYDYGARMYDVQLGRWNVVDPKAEKAPGWSPYRAFFCNPIRYTDHDGQWEWDATGNLVAQKGDQSYSLATFLGTSQKNAMTILNRGGVTANDKGILNLKEGQTFAKSDLWVGFKSGSGPVVNNTSEAKDHYFNGNGTAADVGDNSTVQLLTSNKFQAIHTKITSQEVVPKGYFSIDMTDKEGSFHIGNTGVDYSVSGNGMSSSVTYTLFTNTNKNSSNFSDGFWDPNFVAERTLGKLGIKRYKADEMGPNLEWGKGQPYPYKTRVRTFFFKPVEQ